MLLPHGLAPNAGLPSLTLRQPVIQDRVFNANKKCHLGIISAIIHDNKIEQENGHPVEKKREIAKYFVPAPVIAGFIPPEDRF